MTRDQDWPLFVTCLTKLSANYHDAMMTTEEGIQIKAETYWEALEDLKPVQLEWAVKTMIRNRGGFFPTVHEIRELAYQYTPPQITDGSVKLIREATLLPAEENARRMRELAAQLKAKLEVKK